MDLRLRWGLQGSDLEIENGDLAVDEGLVTPALVSLFSDGRKARTSDGAPEQQDLRGWWGEQEGDPFGSLLWGLAREKLTDATLERARAAAHASLLWLVRQGIAASVVVRAQRIGRDVIGLDVELRRAPSSTWAQLWEATEGVEITTGGMLLNLSAR